MREYLSLISALLLLLLHILIIQKFMTIFMGSGKRNLWGYIGWAFYYVFLVVVDQSDFSSAVLLVGNILFVFMISSVTGRRKIKQRCVFSLLICTVWMLMEVLVGAILGAVGIDVSILPDLGSFVSKMSMLLLSAIVKRYASERHHCEVSLRYFLTILLIPVTSIYLMHNIFSMAASNSEYSRFSVIANLMLLLINYVIFEVYDWMSRETELQAQNQLFKQQLELCERQAEERESLYLQIRRMRHDMKNHLSGLYGMIAAGEIKQAEGYIQGMLDDGIGERMGEVSRSGNIVVDSLINHKYSISQKHGIQFDANIFVPASLPFQNGHLVIILGNLLENALEACRKLPQEQRYIRLEISYVKKMLQVCICNSCLKERKRDDKGKYLTTKSNTIYHGLGLSSVEQAVAYYDGEMVIKDSGGQFQVTVVMYGMEGKNDE